MKKKILFMDDSPTQLEMYKMQMECDYTVLSASNYEESIAILSTTRPHLIVLDMVMPHVDGIAFLGILRSSKAFSEIPVIIVSSDNDASRVRDAFLHGASDYVRKPYDLEELKLRINRLLGSNRPNLMIHESEHPAKDLLIKALADLAATRDNETGHHLERIKLYMDVMVQTSAQESEYASLVSDDFIEFVPGLSILHDIGKVGIPDSILQKPEALNQEEFETMKTHTLLGGETIQKIHTNFPLLTFLHTAKQIALYHHERWDGTGYPLGLAGSDIPLAARMVALCDVFDALTNRRIYKPAYSIDEAVKIMTMGDSTQFDPVLFGVFIKSLPNFILIHKQFGDTL
jgi:putative two-component system response regulator